MPAGHHLADEVASQPDDWERAGARARDLAPLFPRLGERVATIGCGTSWFMGQAYAAYRESAGQGVTDAWAASEPRWGRSYDRVLIITRSGTTTEVIDAVQRLRNLGTPFTALVGAAGTPVAELAAAAGSLVLMTDVDEQSVVQTRFATTCLALLRASLGENLGAVATQARAVLAENESTSIGHLLGLEQLTFLGTGPSVGIASEAALKLRESAQFWTESYPAMEYRHGPISIAAPGRATWVLGEVPDDLADEVRATGALFEHRDLDPLVELVRVHRLSLEMARRAGLDPDRPRHLTRSIVLA